MQPSDNQIIDHMAVLLSPFFEASLLTSLDLGMRKSARLSFPFVLSRTSVCILNRGFLLLFRIIVLLFLFGAYTILSFRSYAGCLRIAPCSLPIHVGLLVSDDLCYLYIDSGIGSQRICVCSFCIPDNHPCWLCCISVPDHLDIYSSRSIRHKHTHIS